jgi:hypothetical protein
MAKNLNDFVQRPPAIPLLSHRLWRGDYAAV